MELEDLKVAVRKHIQCITAINATPALPEALLSQEARSTSLSSLIKRLNLSASARPIPELLEIMIVLEVYLAQDRNNEPKSPDQAAANFLREWVAKAILPTEAFAETSPFSMKENVTLTPDEIAKFHAMSVSGILLLARLQHIEPLSDDEHVVNVLTCLASFTDLTDPWTCSKARDHAYLLSEAYAYSENLQTSITGLLQERIKPLFARTKYPAITQQSFNPLASAAVAHNELAGDAKPWKYGNAYSVTVFLWVLKHSDALSVQANWQLIIPPLLALIDDSSTKYKVKGCNFLAIFLEKCPSLLLERTGMGEVFEKAVTPCLLSLPSLTKEAESLDILTAAYPALTSLTLFRFPGRTYRAAKIEALDRVLRNGVLKGYAQAGEHVRIGQCLVNAMVILVRELGVDSVKHLKHILPLLTSILAAPFATAYPALLQASVKAMKTVIVTGWPRIAHYRGEILKGVIICWCRIGDEEVQSHELNAVLESIKQVVQLLTVAVAQNAEIAEENQNLVDIDGRLRDLLVV